MYFLQKICFYSTVDSSVLSDFLRSLTLPKLKTSQCEELMQRFHCKKFSQKCNFYKAYSMQKRSPHSIDNHRFPEPLLAVNISLILKKDKEEADSSLCRPISLFGCNLKCFSLNKCIPIIIHKDQTDLSPSRLSIFSVQWFLNTTHCKHAKASKVSVLAFDAQKAFDQVECSYILTVTKEFGLGDECASWVLYGCSMLYTCSTASALTNFNKSLPFSLNRGTCQGCPVSPLIIWIPWPSV